MINLSSHFNTAEILPYPVILVSYVSLNVGFCSTILVKSVSKGVASLSDAYPKNSLQTDPFCKIASMYFISPKPCQ